MCFHKARKFIYKNARPLDLARWKFLFENGDREAILEILAEYQNEDGGFGGALEPDCWNPESAPIQTWVATEIIREAKLEDNGHPIIRGILKYLSSGSEFDGQKWSNAVRSNNDHPHAPWWTFEAGQPTSYNPTACLAGFIIKYADKESRLYHLGCRLANEAFEFFASSYPLDSMHTVHCFAALYRYLADANVRDLINLDVYKDLLNRQIKQVITYDTEKWSVEYACKPSMFIESSTSEFYSENREIADFECEFIARTQEEDGTWAITWSWPDYPDAWAISKNWWKSDRIIKNMKYVRSIRD